MSGSISHTINAFTQDDHSSHMKGIIKKMRERNGIASAFRVVMN